METANLMKPDDALASGHILKILPEEETDVLVRDAFGDSAVDGADGEVASEAEEAGRFSDTANAASLVNRVKGRACYCAAMGWMLFDGRRWAVDQRDRIIEEAKAVALANVAVAAAEPDDDARKYLLKAAKVCLAERRIRSMVSLAQSDPVVRVEMNQFDADPLLLNVSNGTIDLRTGELLPHRPEDLITKLAPVDYDPNGDCPTWDAFLFRILDGNTELIQFLQEAVGYSLTGDISEQVLFLLYGTGANGKSTFLETLTDMLGDYWAKMNSETLLDQKRAAGAASEDIALLAGARLVTAVEIPAGRPLNTATIKALTGGDTMQARFLYRSSFSFRPQLKAFLAMNQKPTIHDPTEGIWRRIRLIPFTVTIPAKERDRKLSDKLRSELSGILAWAVRGCLAWRADGMHTPELVTAATDSYRKEQDVLAAFISDCCITGPNLEALTKQIVDAYNKWCEETGENQLSAQVLGRLLNERGFVAARNHRGRIRKGLTLAPQLSDQQS